MKGFKLFAFIALFLALVTTSVFAQTVYNSNITPFATIDKVEVNGIQANFNIPTKVERNSELVVQVFFTGSPVGKCRANNNPCYDVYLEAEINGYEYGNVRDVFGAFEVLPGVQDSVTLRITIPEDMEASDNLDLLLELKDDDDIVLARYKLRMEEQRHKLNIYDVIFNPINNVRAGQPLFTTVRLENLGDNRESSAKVTVSIPTLGIQTSEFVDKLLTEADENIDDDFRFEDDAVTTNDLLLFIPEDAKEGDYNVIVALEYNRGRSVEQKTFRMHVSGTQADQPTVPKEPMAVVNVDAQTQRVEEGNGAVYKFTVANLGQQATSYTFEIVGADAWANTRVEPTNLVVQSDSTADAFVYVAPTEGTSGIKTFTVRVKSNNNVVAEKNLSLEVVADTTKSDVKTVFTWVFIILLIILVILVIVVIVKNLSSKGEGKEGIEGQTYY